MKVVAISDVHEKWQKLQIPKCDILISCGDYSFHGHWEVVEEFHEWLNEQDAGHIISVQGNHETWVEKNFERAKKIAEKACPAVHFIGTEGVVNVEGVKIYGSAVTPWFHNWAWNVDRGPKMAAHWAKIPDDVDILVTHGPPAGMRDIVYRVDGVTPRDRVGCQDLMDRIMQLPKLKHHFFGHIHGSYGHMEFNGVHYWNCSVCDEMYSPDNAITEVDL